MRAAFVLFETLNHTNLVLLEAKSRGFDVVVLNHDPVPQSGPYGVPPGTIDENVYVDSWEDVPAVEALVADVARRYHVVGTYAGFEPGLPYEALLRELAGLPTTGAAGVRRVLDKAAVRRKLYAEGLSELRSVSLAEALGWRRWEFRGPAVLKPVNGTGSALCYVVSSLDELRSAAAKAEEATVVNPLMREYVASRGEFVLEEKAAGELLSVESLVDRGRVHHIGLSGRYVLAADPVVEQGVMFPYHHPRVDEIVAVSEAIHRSLGVFHGPTHVEMMVPAEGPIELIDFNARFAGVDTLVCLNEAFGVDFQRCLADVGCGVEPDLSFLRKRPRVAVDVMLLPPPGTVELRDLVFPPEAVFGRLTKQIGEKLSGNADQLDCIAMFVVVGDTRPEAHSRSLEARRRVLVNGQAVGDNVNNRVAFSTLMDDPTYPS
jgi:hypothetical protein